MNKLDNPSELMGTELDESGAAVPDLAESKPPEPELPEPELPEPELPEPELPASKPPKISWQNLPRLPAKLPDWAGPPNLPEAMPQPIKGLWQVV
ncbi:MAG: hypothetical protein HC857_12660, partial [Synechococcales cyanobacterium RU_4_20]|nr:hypothetical protein [Synechococcales cyanobacterium RU_4_20]